MSVLSFCKTRLTSTGTRMTALVLLLSCFTAVVGVYGMSGLATVKEQADRLYSMELAGTWSIGQLHAGLFNIAMLEKDIILTVAEEDLKPLVQRRTAELARFNDEMAKAKGFFWTEEGSKTFEKMTAEASAWIRVNEEVVRLALERWDTKATALSAGDSRRKLRVVEDRMEALSRINRENAALQTAAIDAAAREVTRTAWAATGVCVALGLGLGVGFARWLKRRLGEEPGVLADMAQRIAAGDLDAAARPGVQPSGVYRAMLGMCQTLKAKILEASEKSAEAAQEARRAGEALEAASQAHARSESARREGVVQAAESVRQIAEGLSLATSELMARIQQSSRGAGEQAERATETATAMDQMTATVAEVARNASRAAVIAADARSKAQEGAGEVDRVIHGIGELHIQAQGLMQDMGELGAQARGIGGVLGVISDIADQTNLLALNAAIEAARAGDAGRGFAVVADEVRKLAEKTMAATRQVAEAVSGIQAGTRKNVDSSARSVEIIGSVTALASRSGESLAEIVRLIDQTSDQVRTIATASEEQSATSEQINRAVEEVSGIAGDTTTAMAHCSRALETLLGQTRSLNALVEELLAA